MSKRKISAVDEKIGRNLVYYRHLEGLTQQQVAEALNISRSTYTKYETGMSEPSIALLRQLAEIFHVTPGQLLESDLNDPSAADVIEGNITKEKHYHLLRHDLNDMSEEEWLRVWHFVEDNKDKK